MTLRYWANFHVLRATATNSTTSINSATSINAANSVNSANSETPKGDRYMDFRHPSKDADPFLYLLYYRKKQEDNNKEDKT